MYEILKTFATIQKWVFNYGRTDFQNLWNEIDSRLTSHLFLDPVEVEKVRNDSGVVEAKIYSGNFMLLFSSDIDELSYDERYRKYIKPILEEQVELIEKDLICEHKASLDVWKIIEVINIFDHNFDGILVTYRVTIEE